MLNEIYEDTEEHMQKSIEALKRDFSTLRTGKVSTNILDHIRVDYYGNPTPLNQVANVLAVDAQRYLLHHGRTYGFSDQKRQFRVQI